MSIEFSAREGGHGKSLLTIAPGEIASTTGASSASNARSNRPAAEAAALPALEMGAVCGHILSRFSPLGFRKKREWLGPSQTITVPSPFLGHTFLLARFFSALLRPLSRPQVTEEPELPSPAY